MSPVDANEHLADTRNITFILRLVLNDRGQIMHGELVDVALPQTQRFKDWNELIQALSKHCKAPSTQAAETKSPRS